MEQPDFAFVTRALARLPSRRDVLRGITGVGLGLGTLNLVDSAGARKKDKPWKKDRPRRKVDRRGARRLIFNEYGCVNVGKPCRGNNANCCSGICEGKAPRKGKPDRSRCVAHNASICTGSSSLCSTGIPPACNPNSAMSTCVRTTGNAGFCADFKTGSESQGASYYCRDCSKDIDCQAEFGPGAACVVYDGICSQFCTATGGTACMPAGD
jgi:hypothetical protein